MDWRDIPSLPALRAFEAAARSGSFSAAARELNVTHAAIGQHVRAVEAHLGTALMQRAGKGMELTADGSRLARDLSDGFAQIIAGVHAVHARNVDRPLSVAVTPSFAENWLMPRLGEFWAKHPDVPVSITPSYKLVDLRRDGFDLAIRWGEGKWPGLETTFLVKGDYVAVASPELLGNKRPTSIAEMTDITWFFSPSMRIYRHWAERGGLTLDKVQIRELDTMSLIAAAVRAGAGASVMVRAMVEDDITSGRLIAIQELHDTGAAYHIATLPGADSAKLRIFRKWLLVQSDDV